jgi:hypothetical protein
VLGRPRPKVRLAKQPYGEVATPAGMVQARERVEGEHRRYVVAGRCCLARNHL